MIQQRPTRVTGFLPTSDPSTRSDRLGHPWFHWNRARTRVVKPIPGSLQINLLFTIFAEQAALHRSDANLFFFKGYVSRSPRHQIELVELSGIEPLTPCLQSRCSPS